MQRRRALGAARAGRREAWLCPLRTVVQLGLIAVAAGTLAPHASPLVPLLAVLESFRPHLAAAGLALMLPALLLRPRLLALLGPACLAWNLWFLWPFLPVGLIPGPGAATDAPQDRPTLKVISANVWYRNDDPGPLLNYLMAGEADAIALIEVTPNRLPALQTLEARYPHRVECVTAPQPCEMLLLSRLPIRRSFAGGIDGASPAIVWGEVEWQGRPVVLAVTHLQWPLMPALDDADAQAAGTLANPPLQGAPRSRQSQQAQALAQYLGRLSSDVGPDIVLMGDFNSVPWSGTLAAFRAATGLDNRGPAAPSWPAWLPRWQRLPIDHIFVGGDLVRTAFRSGRYINSDHLPVEAEIGLKAE